MVDSIAVGFGKKLEIGGKEQNLKQEVGRLTSPPRQVESRFAPHKSEFG